MSVMAAACQAAGLIDLRALRALRQPAMPTAAARTLEALAELLLARMLPPWFWVLEYSVTMPF